MCITQEFLLVTNSEKEKNKTYVFAYFYNLHLNLLFGSYLISILFTIGVWIVSMNNHVCGPITHERHGSLAIKEPEWYTRASVVISVCTEVNVACFKLNQNVSLKGN